MNIDSSQPGPRDAADEPTDVNLEGPLSLESTDFLHGRIRDLETQLQLLQTELSSAHDRPYRNRLPATRQSITHKFEIGHHEGYITVGLYEDGRPGEVFLGGAQK